MLETVARAIAQVVATVIELAVTIVMALFVGPIVLMLGAIPMIALIYLCCWLGELLFPKIDPMITGMALFFLLMLGVPAGVIIWANMGGRL